MPRTITLRDSRGEHRATIDDDGAVTVDGAEIATRIAGPGEVRVAEMGRAFVAVAGDVRWVFLNGDVFEIEVLPDGRRRRAAAADGSLTAPMPATVVRVEVSPGDAVRRGDTLVILEAMKMELPVRAASDGIVKTVNCQAGDLVQPGVALIHLE